MSDLQDELIAAADDWAAKGAVDFWATDQLVAHLMPIIRRALAEAAAEGQRDVAHQFVGAGHACGLRVGTIDGLPATCGQGRDHPVHDAWPAGPNG